MAKLVGYLKQTTYCPIDCWTERVEGEADLIPMLGYVSLRAGTPVSESDQQGYYRAHPLAVGPGCGQDERLEEWGALVAVSDVTLSDTVFDADQLEPICSYIARKREAEWAHDQVSKELELMADGYVGGTLASAQGVRQQCEALAQDLADRLLYSNVPAALLNLL